MLRISVILSLVSLSIAGCFTEEETPPTRNRCEEAVNLCGDMAVSAAGATCVPVGDSFRCECPAPGLRLNANGQCEDVRECDEAVLADICGEGARTCNNTTGSYRCACLDGYVNDGDATQCRLADTDCDSGYLPTGPNGACEDVDECDEPLADLCGAVATGCGNRPGSFSCSCPAGYTNDGDGTPCRAYEDNCEPGFEPTGAGGACVDINECNLFGLAQACGAEGTSCTNTPGSWTCFCSNGHRQLLPGDHCVAAPNDCDIGYLPTGANGSCVDVNECTTLGREVACGPEGTSCRNNLGGYDCDCARGYRQNNPAEECRPAENVCLTGYAPTGINGACENTKECDLNDLAVLCGTGATRCSDTVGSFECHCLPGFKTNGRGTACEEIANTCQSGFAPTGSNGACQDINECTTYGTAAICGAVATGCSNTPAGSYSCQCPAGFANGGPGTPCVDTDPCGSQSVEALCGVATATCEARPGSFFCNCPTGYTNQIISGNPTGVGTKCVDANECADANYCSAFCINEPGGAQCISSIADETSPYWDNYCFGSSRYFDNPTNLDRDCRCAVQRNLPEDPDDPINVAHLACDRVGSVADHAIGTGPSVMNWRIFGGADFGATRYNGAWLDHANRKLYVGAQWKDSTATDGNPELTYYGAILTVDVDFEGNAIGNRELFSGYTLQGSRGTGPTLRAVQAIEKGPDGNLYAVAYESGHPVQIWRFDMATGDRTRVWIEQPTYHGQALSPSQCHNGSRVGFDAIYNGQRYSLQHEMTGTRLAMAPNGDFFLSAKQNGPANGPKGVIRISADGSRCEWVTRFGALGNNTYAERPVGERGADYGLPNGTGPRGGGVNNYTFNPVNLFYMEIEGVAYLYARDGIGSGGLGTRHYRINVATGDRETAFQDIAGDSHTFWDPHRELLWMTGVFGGSIISPVDILGKGGTVGVLGNIRCLSTNSTWYYCMRGPGDIGKQYRGGVVYDPYDHNLLMVHEGVGVVRVEVETGNTYTISR